MSETTKEAFRSDGYVILRDVVPAAQLQSLRATIDELVARQRGGDPAWDTNPTPRANLALHVDPSTRETLDFVLGDNTLGVSTQILDCADDQVAMTAMTVLCNPEFEPTETPVSGQSWGTDPRNWHRDIRPDHDAPLSALLDDERANGAAYTQWNIALYDDAILHLIPGSHRRLTSEVENLQLRADGGTQSPLAGCIRADLNPGDGVVYNSMLLHWGSKYSNRQKRRTIHLGYRSFGRILPTQRDCALVESMCGALPEDSQERRTLERSFELFRSEFDLFETIFRAVIAGDERAFHAGVSRLHPNEEGRLTCVILLSRLARNVHDLSQEREDDVRSNTGTQAATVDMQRQLASRFDASDHAKLWERFGKLDAALRSSERAHVRGFLGPPTDYLYERTPPGLTAESATGMLFGTEDDFD